MLGRVCRSKCHSTRAALLAWVILPYQVPKRIESTPCTTHTKKSLDILQHTGALDPHVVIADVDLTTHVVILEEFHEREERDGILFVVDPRGGHALCIDVVCERLVADLQRC